MRKHKRIDIEGECYKAERIHHGSAGSTSIAWLIQEGTVNISDLTPFRMSKPFEEHMHDVLESVASDPNGLYQVTYRVGPVMVSAQIWVDGSCPPKATMTDYDREFLKELRVLSDWPEEHSTQ